MTLRRITGTGCLILTFAAAVPVGAQEMVGSGVNVQHARTPVETDPDGTGIAEHTRTPTGLLHQAPRVLSPRRETSGGWRVSAHAAFGALLSGGDTENAKFREYRDVASGAYLNDFGVSFEKPDTARYFTARGGAIGRDDQVMRVEGGARNGWRVRGFLNGTPHVFTSTYRSLWTGIGTDRLALTRLTAGGTLDAATTRATIESVLADTPLTAIALTRTKGGARFDIRLPHNATVFASYAREQRSGARPFAMVFGGGGGGGNTEPPESIDASTTDLMTGVSFGGGNTMVSLQGSVSLFRNDIDTFTIENPLFVTTNTVTGLAPTSVQSARYDLHPDNTYRNVRIEIVRRWPALAESRLTGVVSLASYDQNDALLPWTAAAFDGVSINGVPAGGMWNTTAALTHTRADATIDTRLVDIGWSLRPARTLDVRAKLRVFDTDNDTSFTACNPLTGQWGRLLNDGSGGSFVIPHATAGNNPAGTPNTAFNTTGCDYGRTVALGLVPSAGNVNIRNVPYAYRQVTTTVTASYRMTRRNVIDGTYERDTFDREFRERDETWEDRVRVGWVARGLRFGTLRASYTYARRRGSAYVSNPYEPFLSGSFGPLPTATGTNIASWLHAVEQLRKFDVADRDRRLADIRLNVAVAPTVDASVSMQVRDASYPESMFGRMDHQRQVSPTVDLTWQPSLELSLAAFATYQRGSMRQAAVHPLGCVLGNSYFFFSDGSVVANNTGVAPGSPSGASLVGTENVRPSNWHQLCAAAGDTSPLFPMSRAWSADQRDRNMLAGGSAYYSANGVVATAGYTYGRGRTHIDYAYNRAGLGLTDAQVALAGTGWPDLVFDQHSFDADVSVPLRAWAAAHLVYRYERGRIEDWHYEGVDVNPMPAANAAYLDAGPRGYGAHVAGVFVRVSLR